MGKIFDVISGIGVLIALYLFLSRSSATVSIINAIAKNSVNGIQVLQGRSSLITE